MQVLKNGSLSVSPNFLEGFAESSILQYRLHNKSSRQTNYVAILPSPKRRCQHAGFLIHVVRAAESANMGDFRCCRETKVQQRNSVDRRTLQKPRKDYRKPSRKHRCRLIPQSAAIFQRCCEASSQNAKDPKSSGSHQKVNARKPMLYCKLRAPVRTTRQDAPAQNNAQYYTMPYSSLY